MVSANLPLSLILKANRVYILLLALTVLSNCAQQPDREQIAHQQAVLEQQALDKEIAQLKSQILDDIENNRLRYPKHNNALAKIAQLRNIYSDPAEISHLQTLVAQQYIKLIKPALAGNKPQRASAYLERARELAAQTNMDAATITQAEALITDYQEKLKREKAALEKRKLMALIQKQKRAQMEKMIQKQKPPPAPNKHNVALDQAEINSRSKQVGYLFDKISPEILQHNSPVTIRAQSMRDFRWLAALLKTSLYFLDSDFEPVVTHEIINSESPSISYMLSNQSARK